MGNILLAVNVNTGSFHVILRSEPVAGIKNNCTESTNLLGGGSLAYVGHIEASVLN